jgi:transcriptional regulator with XRE-family HTH domain
MHLGERIKNIRALKKLSQKEVALKLEMDQSQYSKIENGKTDPYFSTIEKIATALNVQLNDFLESDNIYKDINSYDKDIIEKLQLIDLLEDNEKKSIFTLIDSLISKKRLRDSMNNALQMNK